MKIDHRLMNAIESGRQKYKEFIDDRTAIIHNWVEGTIFKRITSAEESGKKLIDINEGEVPGPPNINKLEIANKYINTIAGLETNWAGQKIITIRWPNTID